MSGQDLELQLPVGMSIHVCVVKSVLGAVSLVWHGGPELDRYGFKCHLCYPCNFGKLPNL